MDPNTNTFEEAIWRKLKKSQLPYGANEKVGYFTTIQTSGCGVEDDLFPYMLQNVMSALHQRDGSMYTNPPFWGHRIELNSTAQSLESANATLMGHEIWRL